jgi:cytochrome c-type biogenesis protein CcmH
MTEILRLAGSAQNDKKRSVARLLWAVIVVAWLAVPMLARADALDDGVRRVALQLQCPVCEGQSAADSPSGLAADMRVVIRSRLATGASDQQILDEFVASYGDSILTEPPKRGISLGVWLGPAFGVALGAILLTLVLRTWRGARVAPAMPIGSPDPDAVEELRRYRQEFGR